MMKLLLLLALLIQAVLPGQSGEALPKGLTIRFPQNVEPETAMIEFEISGKGGYLTAVQTKKGVFDYSLPAGGMYAGNVGDLKSLKLLVYVPGYRMITANFNETELKTALIFVPPLIPLPTVRLNGQLVNSSQKPLQGETVSVQYHLVEAMGYFGYVDGSFPIVSIASGKTDSDGSFRIDLPALLDDPFFRQYAERDGGFRLFILDPATPGGYSLTPNSFSAQANYPPLLVTKTGRGTLSGKLGKSFLGENNLPDDLKSYVRRGDTLVSGIQLDAQASSVDGRGIGIFSASLKGDGTFEVQLPVGTYELLLRVPKPERIIVVERGIAIQENKRQIVERP